MELESFNPPYVVRWRTRRFASSLIPCYTEWHISYYLYTSICGKYMPPNISHDTISLEITDDIHFVSCFKCFEILKSRLIKEYDSTDQVRTELTKEPEFCKCPVPNCGREVESRKLHAHLFHSHDAVICLIENCGSIFSKDDIDSHMNGFHSLIRCPFEDCDDFIDFDLFKEHLSDHGFLKQ